MNLPYTDVATLCLLKTPFKEYLMAGANKACRRIEGMELVVTGSWDDDLKPQGRN